MKKFQKGLVVSMAAAILLTSTMITTVMATGNQKLGIQSVEEDTNKGRGNDTAWKIAKDNFESEKDVIEVKKDTLEEQKKSLEKEYEAAKESGDLEKAELIETQMQEAKTEVETLKQEMKQKKEEIKAAIKATYTTEELKELEKVSKKIKEKNKNIAVLPVENIIIKGCNVKFDTPPVIKYGRTLVPVKAISEAFGATVQWIAAERKVIITKGDNVIILKLDSNKIYVNGVESTIDVPATSINSRTVVPLSFIAQKLGLKVNWHGDSRDIEIEDPTEPTPPDITTGAAIVIPTGSAIVIN